MRRERIPYMNTEVRRLERERGRKGWGEED
jgi:hypothetical protein